MTSGQIRKSKSDTSIHLDTSLRILMHRVPQKCHGAPSLWCWPYAVFWCWPCSMKLNWQAKCSWQSTLHMELWAKQLYHRINPMVKIKVVWSKLGFQNSDPYFCGPDCSSWENRVFCQVGNLEVNWFFSWSHLADMLWGCMINFWNSSPNLKISNPYAWSEVISAEVWNHFYVELWRYMWGYSSYLGLLVDHPAMQPVPCPSLDLFTRRSPVNQSGAQIHLDVENKGEAHTHTMDSDFFASGLPKIECHTSTCMHLHLFFKIFLG